MYKSALKKSLRYLLRIKRSLLPNFHFASLPAFGGFFQSILSILKCNFIENVQDSKMYLDEHDTLNLSLNRIYEPFETIYFQKHVKDGQVVLDIGAHIGYYTLLLAKNVGRNGQVFAFEPEPKNFALLSKNVEINGYTNVILSNKAVLDTTSQRHLFLSAENMGDHRIFDAPDGKEAVEVDSIRLDDYFADFNKKIDFIKMDIQGAEYYAVQGMASLLLRNPSVVLVTEFEPIGLLRSGVEPEAYLKLLMEMGFTIYHIDENEQRIQNADFQELLRNYSPENGLHTNLVCSRARGVVN